MRILTSENIKEVERLAHDSGISYLQMMENAGSVESVNEWGVRRFAYPINDLTEGYYVLVNFSCAHDFPAELDRVYHITDGILRSLIVKREQ